MCTGAGDRWATATDVEYMTTRDSYEYRSCTCGVLFLVDPPVDQLEAIYPDSYYSYSFGSRGLAERVKGVLDKRVFRTVLHTLDFTKLDVLDVGGGSGYYSDVLLNSDRRIRSTTIVDLDPRLRESVESKGYSFINARIEDATFSQRFHVILAFNLIEHVADPLTLLTRLCDLLEPGGALLLQTPNFDSLDARIFQNHSWGGLHAPRHWVLFTESSLANCLQRAGFDSWIIRHIQGAPFWTVGILAKWPILRTKRERQLPMYQSRAYKILLVMLGVFDLSRSILGFKTSQMYAVARSKSH